MNIADCLRCLPAQKGNVNNLDKPGKWGHVGVASEDVVVFIVASAVDKHEDAEYLFHLLVN